MTTQTFTEWALAVANRDFHFTRPRLGLNLLLYEIEFPKEKLPNMSIIGNLGRSDKICRNRHLFQNRIENSLTREKWT